ncbi:MAG: alpha-ketoacid dehydrogenase subunit beta [Armatimonadetes bacterium]|nr:alpha-ketoacid dehydrogenase subunit beta [Armatimonadota bacterium]MDE2207262.1 alpha-ketoacid dehydrogenase subunit beta [Armatimonadota bacterium]
MTTMRYLEALRVAMREEMERDPNVFVCGEEVAQYQGTFRVTEGLADHFQAERGGMRVLDTPISEAGIVGLATGAAMTGLRPVAEFMTWSFALVAMDQIANHTAKIRYMSSGSVNVPVVLRGPAGTGNQLSAQHSQSLECWYTHMPGLKVVMPATPEDAKGLLKSAIRDDNPVIFMEHAGLYAQKGEVSDDADFTVPFGVAAVRRTGSDVTVVTYSHAVGQCLTAAEVLADQHGIECEVIDIRTLVPLDIDTIAASVAKTHRAVVVHEDWKQCGFGAELASRIYETSFDDLDAPVERVGGPYVPMPYSKPLERLAIPGEMDVVAAVRRATD